MTNKRSCSWRETIGLIDSAIESLEPTEIYRWTNRYGHSKSGSRYVVSLDNDNRENVEHDTLIIAETEIGVQENSFDLATGQMNPIYYLPAYMYKRAVGGIAIASIAISRCGEVVITQTRASFMHFSPENIISDIHTLMSLE